VSHLLQLWIHWSRIAPVIPNPYEVPAGAIVFLGLFGYGRRLLARLSQAGAARADAIDGTLQRAADVDAEAAQVLEQCRALQAEARHEAAALRHEAMAQGARLVAERREEAELGGRSMVIAARAQLDSDRADAYAVLRPDVGELAVDLATRIVGEPLRAGSAGH
jgi:F-type H+-transporting ATPase subunit b